MSATDLAMILRTLFALPAGRLEVGGSRARRTMLRQRCDTSCQSMAFVV